MLEKEIFESIHISFSQALKDYLINDGIDFENLTLSEDESEKMMQLVGKFITENLININEIYKGIQEDVDLESFHVEFNKIWGYCIKLSEIHERLISEIAFQTTKIALPLNDENIKEYVLNRLLCSAIRTYQEIILLMSNGYPYGAISLTRNLFELAVITRYIEQENEAVAWAYFNSSDAPVEFNHKYRWAALSGNFKQKEIITFKKIKDISGFDERFDALYTIYCNFSHSAPQIVINDVDTDIADIYAGPKTFGADAPGIFAATLVGDILTTVKLKNASLDARLKIIFCIGLAYHIRDNFSTLAKKINLTVKEP